MCSQSKIGEACPGPVSYVDAEAFCVGAGARVCTYDELAADAAGGSGCALDDARVWTATPCKKGERFGHFSASGAAAHLEKRPRRCVMNDLEKPTELPVRCPRRAWLGGGPPRGARSARRLAAGS